VISSPLFFNDIDKVHKQPLACWILVFSEILAIQLGAHRVHHHARLHVIDPEVLTTAVAQFGDGLQSTFLCLFVGDGSLGCLRLKLLQQAVGNFNVLADGILALLNQQAAL
jgi:hypothetical protein